MTLIRSRTIINLSRLVTEGRLIKRLQTRGGERWPVGGVGDATRVSLAGGPSRFVLACQPHAEGP